MFAGDSSSYAQFGLYRVPRNTFLQAAQQIEEKAYAFSVRPRSILSPKAYWLRLTSLSSCGC